MGLKVMGSLYNLQFSRIAENPMPGVMVDERDMAPNLLMQLMHLPIGLSGFQPT